MLADVHVPIYNALSHQAYFMWFLGTTNKYSLANLSKLNLTTHTCQQMVNNGVVSFRHLYC